LKRIEPPKSDTYVKQVEQGPPSGPDPNELPPDDYNLSHLGNKKIALNLALSEQSGQVMVDWLACPLPIIGATGEIPWLDNPGGRFSDPRLKRKLLRKPSKTVLGLDIWLWVDRDKPGRPYFGVDAEQVSKSPFYRAVFTCGGYLGVFYERLPVAVKDKLQLLHDRFRTTTVYSKPVGARNIFTYTMSQIHLLCRGSNFYLMVDVMNCPRTSVFVSYLSNYPLQSVMSSSLFRTEN
jgi:hypothetical protein